MLPVSNMVPIKYKREENKNRDEDSNEGWKKYVKTTLVSEPKKDIRNRAQRNSGRLHKMWQ